MIDAILFWIAKAIAEAIVFLIAVGVLVAIVLFAGRSKP